MSRKTWENLFSPEPTLDPAEEETVTELMRSFAHAAAIRRAARDLAQEELLEGAFVQELDEPARAPTRLAAQDPRVRGEPHTDARFQAGPFAVRLWVGVTGAVLVQQEAGPAGATIEIDGRWVPLQPGRPADLGTLAEVPSILALHDATGRTWSLRRG